MKKIILTFFIFLASVTKLSASFCACFYLEYPNDSGVSLMQKYTTLIVDVTAYSATVMPFSMMVDSALYEVEKMHNNSVKNVNMAVLENRESLKLNMRGLVHRELRKDISCNTADSQMQLLETQILYLQQLLAEIAIESNRKLGYEKKIVNSRN